MKGIVIGLFLFSLNVHADADEEAARYCNYLAVMANEISEEFNKLGDDSAMLKKMRDMQEVLKQFDKIEPVRDEAIKNKMTYEQFEEMAKKKGVSVNPNAYKPKYLGTYIRTYCGNTKAEADIKGGVVTSSRLIIEKNFDPKGHAYYNTYKNSPLSK